MEVGPGVGVGNAAAWKPPSREKSPPDNDPASGCPAAPLREKLPPVEVVPGSVVLKLRSNPPPVWAKTRAADRTNNSKEADRTSVLLSLMKCFNLSIPTPAGEMKPLSGD